MSKGTTIKHSALRDKANGSGNHSQPKGQGVLGTSGCYDTSAHGSDRLKLGTPHRVGGGASPTSSKHGGKGIFGKG